MIVKLDNFPKVRGEHNKICQNYHLATWMRLLVAIQLILQVTNDLPMEVPRLVSLSAKQHAKYVKIARCQVQAGFPVYPFYIYIYIHIYPSYTSQKTGGFITIFNPYLFKTQPTHWAQPVRNEALLAGYLQEGLQVDCKNWTQIPTVGRRSNKTTTKNHTKSTKKRQSS